MLQFYLLVYCAINLESSIGYVNINLCIYEANIIYNSSRLIDMKMIHF